MLRLLTALSAAAAASATPETSAFSRPYFYVTPGTSRCFLENVPANLPMTIGYQAVEPTQLQCNLQVTDDSGATVLNKRCTASGEFERETLITQHEGQHTICIRCSTALWTGKEHGKWHLSVDLGDGDMNKEDAVSSFGFISRERAVRALTEKVNLLIKKQFYNQENHKTMSRHTNALAQKVKLLSLLQLLFFGLSTFVATSNMQSFFRKENFVS